MLASFLAGAIWMAFGPVRFFLMAAIGTSLVALMLFREKIIN